MSAIMEYLSGNLIARHVMNLCSEEETANLQVWINESEQNRITYGHLKNIFSGLIQNQN
jgi:hypothetical protein